MSEKIIDIYPDDDPVVIRAYIYKDLTKFLELRTFIDENSVITTTSKDDGKRV